MAASPHSKLSDEAKSGQLPAVSGDDGHLEDQEKILEGRHDVNYPALLTKDVPGG